MTHLNRRAFALSGGAALTLAACGNGVGSRGADTIDARVEATLEQMFAAYPNTLEVADKSVGMLVMPLITEGGLGLGGGYGRGALQIDGVNVDYYSATKGSFGLQIGVQQFSHVLFFMTQDALMDFRHSPGWALGGDAEYTFLETGETLRAETTTSLAPVIAAIFGQAGLRLGAVLEGTKYTRIIP